MTTTMKTKNDDNKAPTRSPRSHLIEVLFYPLAQPTHHRHNKLVNGGVNEGAGYKLYLIVDWRGDDDCCFLFDMAQQIWYGTRITI